MKIPDIPINDIQRTNALKDLNILDTNSETSLDDLTKLASIICNTPIALISLVDEKRQWFKSKVGLEANETPREYSFCGHAIHSNEIFEIENALNDPRFFDNPLVLNDPKVVFYAGAPIITSNNFNIGTLCVIDNSPKKLSAKQLEALRLISKQIIFIIENKRKNEINKLESMKMNSLLNFYSYCVFR